MVHHGTSAGRDHGVGADDSEYRITATTEQRRNRVIDEAPRPGSRGTTVAFVHPKTAFGTLIELVEETQPEPTEWAAQAESTNG